MKNHTIEIENLKCGGCANTIGKALRSFNELKDVSVNVEEDLVQFNSDDAGFEKALRKLKILGYPQKGESNIFLAAKSYVSCAVGRVSAKSE